MHDTPEKIRTSSNIAPDGAVEVEFGVSRGYIWSTGAGSQLTLLCDRYVELEDLRGIELDLVHPDS